MSLPSSLRSLVPLLLVAVALVGLVVLVVRASRDPEVAALDPVVVSPGDEVMVSGRHFGEMPGSVVLAGQTLPTSAIVSWSDDEIRFNAPRNVTSGLLYVVSDRGRSEGLLVQVREAIPRTAFTGDGPGTPVITGIDSSELEIGGLVTLSGVNFGRVRRDSRVVFSMPSGLSCEPCRQEISYASWSDSRIVVRVPEGAVSGFVSVVTPWGTSNPLRVTVARTAGAVVAERPLEIALHYGARVSDVQLHASSNPVPPGARDIAVRLPYVPVSSAQRSIRYLGEPPGILRFERVDPGFEQEIVRTVILRRYSVRTEVDVARVPSAFETETAFFSYYTKPLPELPVTDPGVQQIAGRLRANRTNPYRIAEAAYGHIVDNLSFALGVPDRSPLGGLASGYGDSYTYALLFVTLVRAARVPARPVGGVLVTDDGHAYPHFWAEFFLPGIGWVPVDPALGDGAFPALFPVPGDPRAHYFGNLDNRRVAFLYGYDARQRSILDGAGVVPEDIYTVQLSYAEGGSGIESFRLGWSVPRVIGLFGPD